MSVISPNHPTLRSVRIIMNYRSSTPFILPPPRTSGLAPSGTPPHEDATPADVASHLVDLDDLQDHFSTFFRPSGCYHDCSETEEEDEDDESTTDSLNPIWKQVITEDESSRKHREEASVQEKIRMFMSRCEEPGALAEAPRPRRVVVEGIPQYAEVETLGADFDFALPSLAASGGETERGEEAEEKDDSSVVGLLGYGPHEDAPSVAEPRCTHGSPRIRWARLLARVQSEFMRWSLIHMQHSPIAGLARFHYHKERIVFATARLKRVVLDVVCSWSSEDSGTTCLNGCGVARERWLAV